MMYIEKIATMIGFLAIFIITANERVIADKNVESSSSYVTSIPSNVTSKVVNVTKTVFSAKRRAVLILNSDSSLRSDRDKNEVNSLHYQEFDDNNKLLNTMWMYNLKDVAEFFRVFLNTEICYERCKN